MLPADQGRYPDQPGPVGLHRLKAGVDILNLRMHYIDEVDVSIPDSDTARAV